MATYVFKINGTTKTLQPGWSITETQNGQNRMDFTLQSLDGSFRVVQDDEIAYTEDGVAIFGGLVDNPGESGFGGASSTTAITQKVSAVDYNVYPSRLQVGIDTDRPSESLKARMTWIAGLMTDQGVSLDASQVTGPTLPAATYLADRYLVDVLAETMSLAAGTGATSWAWNIDYTKVLIALETDSGANPAPWDVADGDGHVTGDITVEQPRPSEYGNYIVVLGGTGTKDRTDTFTGDGSTVTFALNYTLANSYGYVTVDGIFETLGPGTATWSYDASTNSITRIAAPGVGIVISITYVAQFPLRVVSDGGASAAARVVRTYDEPDVFDRDVLQALADSYVTRDIAAPKTVRYVSASDRTGSNAVHPGQVQDITVSKRNLSGDHTITEVRIANTIGTVVRRFVTAVTSTRLPANLRQKFQQAFGSSGTSAAATSVTVISGATFLSSPAPLGGSDTTFRACDSSTRVPNALPYVAPTTMAVRVRGVAVAAASANMTPSLYDETGSSEVSGSPVSSSRTPADFSFDTTVTSGHKYWLHVLSGTAGIAGSACAVLEGR